MFLLSFLFVLLLRLYSLIPDPCSCFHFCCCCCHCCYRCCCCRCCCYCRCCHCYCCRRCCCCCRHCCRCLLVYASLTRQLSEQAMVSAPSALVSKFDFGAAGLSRGTIPRLMWSPNYTAAGPPCGEPPVPRLAEAPHPPPLARLHPGHQVSSLLCQSLPTKQGDDHGQYLYQVQLQGHHDQVSQGAGCRGRHERLQEASLFQPLYHRSVSQRLKDS